MGKKEGEAEIRKVWNAPEYQKLHEEARKNIEQYLKELNYLYQEKAKEGFIRYMESRMKTPESIMQKLDRKGLAWNVKNMEKHLHDVSGVRVICFDIKEIYWIASRIARDERYEIIKFKDYIRKPKKNGYESFHIVLNVPVEVMLEKDQREQKGVQVELQLRTIVMDAWASLDSRIRYKKNSKVSEELEQRMHKYAKTCRRMDRMIRRMLAEADS